MLDVAGDLAKAHGERLGVDTLAYPTSWAHTREEIDRLKTALRKDQS